MEAFLILEDGTIFKGTSIGSRREVISEIVFNTAMTGYLEIMSDPSYANQMLLMTYPLIGNYGINNEDMQSNKLWIDGLIARELYENNIGDTFNRNISSLLKKYNIPGIIGIDTRELVLKIRKEGTMYGMITTNKNFDINVCKKRINSNYLVKKAVYRVSRKNVKTLKNDKIKYNVALMDYGTKRGICNSLLCRGCQVTIYPAFTKAIEILKNNYDGIVLSNGPGDPREYTEIINEVKKIFDSDIPILGICLGHQLLALANDLEVEKMKFGHRGVNHPVKNLETGKLYISTQNHGYVVNPNTIKRSKVSINFMNINDGTVEGLKYIGKDIISVQFHPESCAGTNDLNIIFDKFIEIMENRKNVNR